MRRALATPGVCPERAAIKPEPNRETLAGCLGAFDCAGGELERGVANSLGHGAAAEALRAGADRGVGSVGSRDADALQVGFELASRNAGHLGADAPQILRFTANRHAVAQHGCFTANLAMHGHRRRLELAVGGNTQNRQYIQFRETRKRKKTRFRSRFARAFQARIAGLIGLLRRSKTRAAFRMESQ